MALCRPGLAGGTSLDTLNARSGRDLMGVLGIVFTELGDGYLRATMPVDARTHQPYGLLHGGASVALAPSAAAAGMLMAGGHAVVGLERSNHLRCVCHGRDQHCAVAPSGAAQVWEIADRGRGQQPGHQPPDPGGVAAAAGVRRRAPAA